VLTLGKRGVFRRPVGGGITAMLNDVSHAFSFILNQGTVLE
jgi:hypothetical protein